MIAIKRYKCKNNGICTENHLFGRVIVATESKAQYNESSDFYTATFCVRFHNCILFYDRNMCFADILTTL
jgi:hypothetical protein